ncbi:TIGR01777 family oxidoreductase [Lacinutrix salivirga]
MKILITGATGLIGSEIVKICHKNNHTVHYLTTSKNKLEQQENYKGFFWNPDKNEIDSECLNGVEAIIHLVGASISKRWTESYKKTILLSRLQTTQLLFNTLKETTNHNVKQIVSASAIGFYPSSLTNYYSEKHEEASTSFLGEVVEQWEQAVDSFSSLNITVSKVRIGLVMSNNGGALPEIVKPVKYGVGAAFGSGEQWQSWIHINDLARIFVYVLEHKLEGIYNGVAPNPQTNAQLTKAVAKQLKKPLFLPNIPKFFMKLVLGEMHILLFESQRVSSKKIEDKGFEFKYHCLQNALADIL